MPTGSGHLHGSLDMFLPFHIGKIIVKLILPRIELTACIHYSRFQESGAVQVIDHLGDMLYAIDLQLVYYSSLADVAFGYKETLETHLASLDGNGKCTANGHQRTVETEFAHHHILAQLTGIHLVLSSQNAYGHRQIIARTFLSDVGRREVDGNLTCGESESAVLYGSQDTLVTLLHRIVGKAHEHKSHTPRSVYLDGDSCGLKPLHTGSEYLYKHSLRAFGSMSRDQSEPDAMIFWVVSTSTKKGRWRMCHLAARSLENAL